MSGEPYTSFEVIVDRNHEYPFVDIEMKGGQRVRGYVVPEHLEDKLPSAFDGMQMWSNPLLDLPTGTILDNLETA